MTPENLLDNIFVSRAFTCYQMEAVITERLPAFVRRSRSPVVMIFGLLDTFYDEQAPLFEVRRELRADHRGAPAAAARAISPCCSPPPDCARRPRTERTLPVPDRHGPGVPDRRVTQGAQRTAAMICRTR